MNRTPKNKKSLTMKRQHRRALRHYECGRMEQALGILENLLKRRNESEWWNDWASVQLARGKPSDAERGYQNAIQLDPANRVAELNLGVYLATAGRSSEAIPLMLPSLPTLDPASRKAVEALLGQCGHPILESATGAQPPAILRRGRNRSEASPANRRRREKDE